MKTSFYFTRLTVDSDKGYYPSSLSLLDKFSYEALNIKEIMNIVDIYEEKFGYNILKEIKENRILEDVELAKQFQWVLFLCLSLYFERVNKVEVNSVGFYSAGVIPAYFFSGILDFEQAFFQANSIFVKIFENICGIAQENPLYESLLISSENEDLLSKCEEFIRSHDFGEKLFIKDVKSKNIILLAGFSDAFDFVNKAIILKKYPFENIKIKSTKKRNVNAAHLNLIEKNMFEDLLGEMVFNSPRVHVVGTQGQVIKPLCENKKLMKEVFLNALLSEMNTFNAIKKILLLSPRICLIGSRYASKVLHGIEGLKNEQICFVK